MPSVARYTAGVTTRDAVPSDNDALLKLAEACPMRGDIALCVSRSPDFFALNKLEGDTFRVGVAEDDAGRVIGCVAAARRVVYLRGRPVTTVYVGDLKVHPDHRGGEAADKLEQFAREASRDLGGNEAPVSLTILAGNSSMERRAPGPRGTPVLHRFATIRAHAVSLIWPRRSAPGDFVIARGKHDDLEEMAELWRRVSPARQFGAVHDAESLAAWVRAAPSLVCSSYFIARTRAGRMAGFLALWDQSAFKQLRVIAYSRRLAAFRAGYNVLAPSLGAARLPAAGAPLRYLSAVHVCVPQDSPGVLRALVLHSYNALRGGPYSFFTIGLDVLDPLSKALGGLMAQPTDIHAYITTPTGRYGGPALDDRPLHHEIALV